MIEVQMIEEEETKLKEENAERRRNSRVSKEADSHVKEKEDDLR